MMIEKKIIALAIFIAFMLTPFVSAGEKATFVFDLSKVETDDSWEEVFVGKGGGSGDWCTDNTIIYFEYSEWRVLNITTKDHQTFPLKNKKTYSPGGCSSDGRYVFMQNRPYSNRPTDRKKDEGDYGYLEIIDLKNKAVAKTLSIPQGMAIKAKLSPDRKMLAWFDKGEISLNDNYTVSLVPVFKYVKEKIYNLVWSHDGKKIYMLSGFKKKQKFIEYEVSSRSYRSYKFDLKKSYVDNFKVHPDGKRIFLKIWSSFPGDNHYSRRGLYELNLKDLSSSVSLVKPLLFMEYVSSFDISESGDLVLEFSHFGDPFTVRWPPNDNLGIYLLKYGGKALEKLTKDFTDSRPKFSKNEKAISFARRGPGSPGDSAIYSYLLLKE